jgi:hypothetical protein
VACAGSAPGWAWASRCAAQVDQRRAVDLRLRPRTRRTAQRPYHSPESGPLATAVGTDCAPARHRGHSAGRVWMGCRRTPHPTLAGSGSPRGVSPLRRRHRELRSGAFWRRTALEPARCPGPRAGARSPGRAALFRHRVSPHQSSLMRFDVIRGDYRAARQGAHRRGMLRERSAGSFGPVRRLHTFVRVRDRAWSHHVAPRSAGHLGSATSGRLRRLPHAFQSDARQRAPWTYAAARGRPSAGSGSEEGGISATSCPRGGAWRGDLPPRRSAGLLCAGPRPPTVSLGPRYPRGRDSPPGELPRLRRLSCVGPCARPVARRERAAALQRRLRARPRQRRTRRVRRLPGGRARAGRPTPYWEGVWGRPARLGACSPPSATW